MYRLIKRILRLYIVLASAKIISYADTSVKLTVISVFDQGISLDAEMVDRDRSTCQTLLFSWASSTRGTTRFEAFAKSSVRAGGDANPNYQNYHSEMRAVRWDKLRNTIIKWRGINAAGGGKASHPQAKYYERPQILSLLFKSEIAKRGGCWTTLV